MRGSIDGGAFENRGAPSVAATIVGDCVRHGGGFLRQEAGCEAPFERRCGGPASLLGNAGGLLVRSVASWRAAGEAG